MKKSLIIYTLLCAFFFSCKEEEIISSGGSEGGSGKNTLQFKMNVPVFNRVGTKATAIFENAISDLWLLVFDENGMFLERVHADNLVSEEDANGSGYGTFTASVSERAGIIHFIGNWDQWSTFDDRAAYQKDEGELLPAMKANNLVFWGRSIITSVTVPQNVVLYRNQAKVTVENLAGNFEVTGYALSNFAETGTVVPYNQNETPTPFVILDNIPTLPRDTVYRASQADSDCNLDPKFMFENPNYYNNQAFVIIKGKLDDGPELFYKIQFLNDQTEPYKIMRNHHYRIVINSFSEQADGSTTFEDAKNAEVSNDIYADIFKDSPIISDEHNNVLTVGAIDLLYIEGGTMNVAANYTQNGINANDQITVTLIDDPNGIISGLSYSSANASITATVKKITLGQQTATIKVKAGILSRIITVISSGYYRFNPAFFNPGFYQLTDQIMILNFRIPANIPNSFYPLKCLITTSYLYPIEPNGDLTVEFEDNTYKYVYWATSPGSKMLNFRTSMANSDETVTIENEYFITANVKVKSRYFNNISVNNNNIVNYAANSAATVRFTLVDDPDSPATYPLTVKIATNNLTTTQSGWTAVSGGYSCVYNSAPSGEQIVQFVTNKASSHEQVTISAEGFRDGTVYFDNLLSQSIRVSGNIRVLQNGTYYSIPRYSVTTSNTSIIPNFTVSSSSTYSFTISSGTKLSEVITFSSRGFVGSYTIEQLLDNPMLVLQ